jgi:hypothetical protein
MEKDRIGVSDIIREMRIGNAQHREWADALEASMQEPVAVANKQGLVHEYFSPGTKLFAFPPDAAGEIERLDGLCVQVIDLMKKKDAEIERLKSSLQLFVDRLKAQEAITDKFAAEAARLRNRVGDRGLEVVMIDGVGHYVSEVVRGEIERLKRDCIERFPSFAKEDKP